MFKIDNSLLLHDTPANKHSAIGNSDYGHSINRHPANKPYLSDHPKLSNKNWVKIGDIKKLFIYPVKGGGKMEYDCFRINQHGMIRKDERMNHLPIWDGMFLIYDKHTRTIQNFSDYWPINTITVKVESEFITFENLEQENVNELVVDITEDAKAKRKIFYYSSWYGGRPIKLIDCGDEAARWLNRCLQHPTFGKSLRLVQRNYDPLIEEPNLIKEKWMEYSLVHSTKADVKPEVFANVARVVLATTCTLTKLRKAWSRTLDNCVSRPNIIISTDEIVPFSEEDWEWIKIRNTVIRLIKPIPIYNVPETSRVPSSDIYTNLNEDDTAHSGIYCASYVPGEIKLNDDVYVYYNHNNRTGKYDYFDF